MSFSLEFHPSWPYDDALLWMEKSRARVIAEPHMIVLGCGVHDEKIITLGKNHRQNEWPTIDGTLVRTLDRGGGPTAHEPGQIVLYPIINIAHWRITIPALVESLEDAMADFMAMYFVEAKRSSHGPGMYIGAKKVGFIGLRIKDNVSTHGLAINVLNDAKIFSHFSPCGISGLKVTSLKYHVDLNNTDVNDCMKTLARAVMARLSNAIGCSKLSATRLYQVPLWLA